MEKTISFGKVAYTSTRKVNEITVDVRLKQNADGQYVFSACGEIWNARKTDIVCGGQCLDTLYHCLKDNKTMNKQFERIYRLWKLYHLNDCHAGTERQEKALAMANKLCADYKECCDYLNSVGLLYDNGYLYGSSWLYREIPSDDLKSIKEIVGMV